MTVNLDGGSCCWDFQQESQQAGVMLLVMAADSQARWGFQKVS